MTPLLYFIITWDSFDGWNDKGSRSTDANAKLEKFHCTESFMKWCEAGKILEMFECLNTVRKGLAE